MRDIAITLIVFSMLPFVVFRPYIGILLWSWLGYMNPHRLAWGFAFDFPFSEITAIATFIGLLFWREPKRFPLNGVTILWLLLLVWMTFTTTVALSPDTAWLQWQKVMKIQLFALLTVLLMQRKDRLTALVWVVALSLGFYGLKGGLFVLRSGGEWRVWGPPGTFIADNNALALSIIMILPLLWYLYVSYQNRTVRIMLAITMVLCCLSVLGSHSRGAALAGSAMLVLLWLKSSHRLKAGAALLLVIPFLVLFMPKKYFERVETISSYEQDTSAMGRIRAWTFATDLAVQRPIGGGFESFVEENYRKYAPRVAAEIDAQQVAFQESHSIYFRMLGEHGFPGLLLFLALGTAAYRMAGGVIQATRGHEPLAWAGNLAAMLQVGLVGYAVGGAFLGLAYFDLYYHLISIIVVLRLLVTDELAALAAGPAEAAWNGLGVPGYRHAAP